MFSFLAPVVKQLEPINGCFCCLTTNNLFLFGSNAELDYVLEHRVQKNNHVSCRIFFPPSTDRRPIILVCEVSHVYMGLCDKEKKWWASYWLQRCFMAWSGLNMKSEGSRQRVSIKSSELGLTGSWRKAECQRGFDMLGCIALTLYECWELLQKVLQQLTAFKL